MSGSLSVMAVLGYAGYFASTLYPEIPATLGGGKPTAVRFLLRCDGPAGPAAGVLTRDPPGPFSVP